MAEDIEAQFRPFRRYCMMLASQPSLPVLEKLNEMVITSDEKTLQNLQDYIILPMQMYLRSPNMPENYTLAVLNFIRDFYSVVKLTSKFLMTDLLQNLLPLLSPNDLQNLSDSGSKTKNVRISLSEDMKIALCSCLANLIRNSDNSIKTDVLYNEDYKLQISHLVFQVLEWTETEDVTAVVMSSLKLVNELCFTKCILDIGNKTVQNITYDSKVCTEFVSQFTEMLPGITSRLLKVLKPKKASSNEKPKNLKIKANVLMVWCNYVCAIINDRNIHFDDVMDIDEGIGDLSTTKNGNLSLLRSNEWVGKAQNHLLQHIQLLVNYNFITSDKWYLRNVMFLLCEATIQHCSKSLKCFDSVQIDILAMLSVDDESFELAYRSESCLQRLLDNKQSGNRISAALEKDEFGSSPSNTEMISVAEQAQVKLFGICESLLASTSNLYEETELNIQLSQLHGFLVLLKNVESSCLFFRSETYVGKLLDALLSVVTLEGNVLIGENVLRDYTNFDFVFKPELYLKLGRQQKAFKHLKNEKLRKRTTNIARLLSKYANINLIIEHLSKNLVSVNDSFVEKVNVDGKYRKETIYILNEMIMGIPTELERGYSKQHVRENLDTLVDLYLNLDNFISHFTLRSTLEMEKYDAISQKRLATEEAIDWTERCLVIEGLGIFALAAKQSCLDQHFKCNHLGEILVFILSETNLTKNHSAHVLYHTLTDLASANNYTNIEAMLRENLDYLSRELAILLRKYLSASSKTRKKGKERPDGLPTLLKAVLKTQNLNCPKIVDLAELRDTIEVLLYQLDLSWVDPDKSVTTEILQIITIFTNAFADSNPSYRDHGAINNKCVNANLERGVLTQLIIDIKASDYLEQKFMEEGTEESHCPNTGFHNEEIEENVSYETESETTKVVPDKIKFLRQTVEHTRHFISMVACPQWQLLSLGMPIKRFITHLMHRTTISASLAAKHFSKILFLIILFQKLLEMPFPSSKWNEMSSCL